MALNTQNNYQLATVTIYLRLFLQELIMMKPRVHFILVVNSVFCKGLNLVLVDIAYTLV